MILQTINRAIPLFRLYPNIASQKYPRWSNRTNKWINTKNRLNRLQERIAFRNWNIPLRRIFHGLKGANARHLPREKRIRWRNSKKNWTGKQSGHVWGESIPRLIRRDSHHGDEKPFIAAVGRVRGKEIRGENKVTMNHPWFVSTRRSAASRRPSLRFRQRVATLRRERSATSTTPCLN